MAYELLPVQMNCQLNFPRIDFLRNGYSDSLLTFPPAIVHYPKNTIHWSCHGYVGEFSATVQGGKQSSLPEVFPFTKNIYLGRINQYFDQGHGGPPLFYGIHALETKGKAAMAIDFTIVVICIENPTSYKRHWRGILRKCLEYV